MARGIRGSPTGHPIHVTVQDGAQGKTPCRREGTPHRASVSPDMKALLAAGRNAAGSFPGRHPAPRLTPPGARRQRCFQTGPSGSCGTAPAHPPHALAQGRGHPVTGMQASPSLLQAPTGLLVPQEPSQKAFGNPPCGAPASIPHCHRAPPMSEHPQSSCSHPGCSAIPRLSRRGPFPRLSRQHNTGTPPAALPAAAQQFPYIMDLMIHQLGADRLRLGAAFPVPAQTALPGD